MLTTIARGFRLSPEKDLQQKVQQNSYSLLLEIETRKLHSTACFISWVGVLKRQRTTQHVATAKVELNNALRKFVDCSLQQKVLFVT